MADTAAQPYQGGPRILLNLKNYHTWATLVKSELNNINCSEVVGTDLTKLMPEKEKKGYHLIIRYLGKEALGLLSNLLKPEDKGRGSAVWKILKNKFAGSTLWCSICVAMPKAHFIGVVIA